MNPAIVIKLLDLVFLGLSAYQHHEQAKEQSDSIADDIRKIRDGVLLGDMKPEEAEAKIDSLFNVLRSRRKSMIDALPRPTFGLHE